ncbi:hypothetical protein BLNAU_6912 [Blattamonas nauphoetae]|uniref:Uncharacterized protein n=1 Tax=Blattamonas nauphoetae TaxID=2049346 RepID=A0ABQ9Y3D5_9EUKA|nr:hypothetical protein BLNAU_6912 [Blattamonas nauphoetae]
MTAEPTLNPIDRANPRARTERELGPLIADCLQKYRDGDKSSKQKTALVVYSLFLSENNDIHKLSEEVMSSGLMEEFCSTLASPCSEELFVSVSGIVSIVVSGASLPFRVGVSSLLPSLVNLVSVCLFFLLFTLSFFSFSPCASVCVSVDVQKSSSKVVESASRVVGHLCRVSMSGGDVEGVLNSGVVEGLCKQSSMIVSCGDGIGSGHGLSVLKSLDSLCMGLKSFLRNEEQSKKTTETKKNEGKKEESENRFSVVNRSRVALSEIEWTLREMIVEIGKEEERGEDEGRREISEKIGGMLIRHFPESFGGRREKKDGMIGIDIGRLRLEMEENEKRREMESRNERAILREERESISRLLTELQNERRQNQQFIKEGRERQEMEEAGRKRQSKMGAAAIEFFHPENYGLAGNTFTKQYDGGGCLVSFEFGDVVARLSLIVGGDPQSYFDLQSHFNVGIISSVLAANAQATSLIDLKGGAGGWDLCSINRGTRLNSTYTNQFHACAAGAAGQRVVIEADGRKGRRTVRMSQDGQTQPAFFTNIPVPFRFVVFMYVQNNSVTIESVEVVKEALLVGGTIPVQM